MKKYRLRKQVIIIPIAILAIVLITVFFLKKDKSKAYSLEYSISSYNIQENYDKTYQSYYFEISYNHKKYPFVYESKYINKKKLIDNIEYIENDSIECINIKSDYFKSKPICYQDDNVMDYSLVQLEELNKYKEDISNLDLELENYTIYNDDHQVLIWNYKGFNYIKNNKIKEVKIFNKDIYNIPLHMKINNYILIPDYEQEYTFNKLYIVNTEDMKVSEWKIDYNISFNSVFLGINDKSIFLLDKQNKKEYELVPHKKKIRIVGSHNKGLIYKKGKSEKVTINSLLNEKEVFKYNNIYNYELIDNKLYLSYIDSKIKYQITNKVVNNITYINNDSVYYIVDNILYAYNPDDGEYKILEYSEFKYNEKNPIYIN